MAYISISEHTAGSSASMQMGKWPPLIVQTDLTIGAGAVQSAAFGGDTKALRVNCRAACKISVGLNPDASVDGVGFSAGQTEWMNVEPGHKLSVIQTT